MSLPNEIRVIDKVKNIWVYTHDIPKYKNEYFECVTFYVDFKNLGNPFNKGWFDWPCWAYDIINVLNCVNWSSDA